MKNYVLDVGCVSKYVRNITDLMCRMAGIFMKEKTVRYAEKCAKQCPTNALSVYGISKTVEEIAEEAYRDSMVFPEFGGVTFSGGECLLQAQNVKKTAEILKQKGIHICIDTALNVAWDTIEGILPYTDLF